MYFEAFRNTFNATKIANPISALIASGKMITSFQDEIYIINTVNTGREVWGR